MGASGEIESNLLTASCANVVPEKHAERERARVIGGKMWEWLANKISESLVRDGVLPLADARSGPRICDPQQCHFPTAAQRVPGWAAGLTTAGVPLGRVV